jgi:hypothetical protein
MLTKATFKIQIPRTLLSIIHSNRFNLDLTRARWLKASETIILLLAEKHKMFKENAPMGLKSFLSYDLDKKQVVRGKERYCTHSVTGAGEPINNKYLRCIESA